MIVYKYYILLQEKMVSAFSDSVQMEMWTGRSYGARALHPSVSALLKITCLLRMHETKVHETKVLSSPAKVKYAVQQ